MPKHMARDLATLVRRMEEEARRHCALAWSRDRIWDCDCRKCVAVRVHGVSCTCVDTKSVTGAECGHRLDCPVMLGLRVPLAKVLAAFGFNVRSENYRLDI